MGEIYKKIKDEEFPNVKPLNNLNRGNYDDAMYWNIRKSYIYLIAKRLSAFPSS